MHTPKQAAEMQKSPDSSREAIQFRRQDWMDFRDPNRISNKAGVPFQKLPQVVAKELCDDALDASDEVEFGLLDVREDSILFFVADNGPGLNGTDAEIAELYSIRRPLASSKMLRLPTRGMLGNGLRVVAGVVLVSDGDLRVSTRVRTLTLRPEREDGHTRIVKVEPWIGAGTRVEVSLRGELARQAQSHEDGGLFDWAEEARKLAGGRPYKGKTSPHWYDEAGFWELLRAAGQLSVNNFVEKFLEGCSDKVREIAAHFGGRLCDTLTKDEATALLQRACASTRPVGADRLGRVGRRPDYFGYACVTGEFEAHGAKIPFVVEAWANRARGAEGVVCVNRTPVCANVNVRRDEGSDYAIFGCQLRHRFPAGRKDAGEFRVLLNVITPYVPLTSSGKDPDLSAMVGQVLDALEKAIRVAKRTAPKIGGSKRTQKAIIRERIQAAATKLSGGGKYLFSLRQLFYELRPYLIAALGREPDYGTFSRIVGVYEDENGDVEHLYRDDRGTLYHPHTKETIPLGTRSIATYERPLFGYRSLLFCEKEGLFPMLKHARWPEQFDCALCSSKGFATRAVRALIRLLKQSKEPITVFVVHDADGPGTMIFETLKRALKPYGIKVVNLGLEPAEGREMGLTWEPVKRKMNKRVPVADYVPLSDREWLQENRIELNAMSTPQFMDWLSAKFTDYYQKNRFFHKVVPPTHLLKEHLERETRDGIKRRIVAEVLKNANISQQVEVAMTKIKDPLAGTMSALSRELKKRLTDTPVAHWTHLVKTDAASLVMPAEEGNGQSP